MEEIWKYINDYEGLYQVSNYGMVKSLKFCNERILKAGKDKKGYLSVILCKDGVKKTFKVHRLVAEAFIPNPENKPCIDHIVPVSIGGTNEASNLRWCTCQENNNNPLTKQKFKGEKNPMYGKSGAENPRSKPIIGVNKKTGEEVRFPCAREAERVLGIFAKNISSCLKGKRKSAGGWMWRYA